MRMRTPGQLRTRRRVWGKVAVVAVGVAALLGMPEGVARVEADLIRYHLTDLGVLPGYTGSIAMDINDHGHIIGHSYEPGGIPSRPMLWVDGVLTEVHAGQPVGSFEYGLAINNAGQFVTHHQGRAYRHEPDGSMVELGRPIEWKDDSGILSNVAWAATPHGINAHGHVVGHVTISGSNSVGFLYADGVMRQLPSLSGTMSPWDSTRAFAINDQGLIVGDSFLRAVLYDGDSLIDLHPGGDDDSVSYAVAVNNHGQVLVTFLNPFGIAVSLLYDHRDGSLTVIEPLAGWAENWLLGLNDFGSVVGYAAHDGSGLPNARAILHENGVTTDLNTVVLHGEGWVLERATAINNVGQIVGRGYYGGQARAFLLTPVVIPEPSSLALASLGLIGLLGYDRWHRRRRTRGASPTVEEGRGAAPRQPAGVPSSSQPRTQPVGPARPVERRAARY